MDPLDYAQPLARRGVSIQASPGLLNVTLTLIPNHKQFAGAVLVAVVWTLLLPLPFFFFLHHLTGPVWATAITVPLYLAYACFILLPLFHALFARPTPRLQAEVTPTSLILTRLNLTPPQTLTFSRGTISSAFCDLNAHSTRKSSPFGEWALGLRRPGHPLTLIDLGLNEPTARWLVGEINAALQSPVSPRSPHAEHADPDR